MVIDYVRTYGFDEEFQSNYTLEMGYSMDKSVTDVDVEKMITRLVGQTRELLSKNLPLLKKLAKKLAETGKLTPAEIVVFAQKHAVAAVVHPEGFLKIHPYHRELK